ncbi:MAG: glycosyltransferase family 4 protein [Pseudomonadota bacterium]
MRIVHVITCLLNGGSEENTIATCNGQANRGHEVWLLYGREFDQDKKATVSDKVRMRQVPELVRHLDPYRDLKALFDIGKTLREIKPTVLHTHASKAGFLGRLAACHSGIPIVLHGVHILPFLNVSPTRRVLYLAMERLVAPRTDAFVAVSQGMKDANVSAGLGSVENNFVVYSGMDVERFKHAVPIETRPEGRMLTMVASLEARKRHLDFIDVFARLTQHHPDLNLCLVGEGEFEAEIIAKIEKYGIGTKVRLEGFRPNVEQYIAAADICVLASKREGLPRVVVQYVAAGKPVVLTWLPGVEEILKHGVNGLIIDSEEVADMEGDLNQLLSDEDMMKDMAENSLQFDVSKWSLGAMEPKIEAIIRNLVQKKGVSIDGHSGSETAQLEVKASQ